MRLESLDPRRLMAVTVGNASGTLYLVGDAASNGLAVEQANGQVIVQQYKNGKYQQIAKASAAVVSKIYLLGGDGDDTLSVSNAVTAPAVVMGGSGNDYCQAGGGETSLYGFGVKDSDHTKLYDAAKDDGGNDTLLGGLKNTYLFGQKGDDTFHSHRPGGTFPNTGADAMYGGDGRDVFHVDGAQYRVAAVHGEGGDDVFHLGSQAAFVLGGAGVDTADYSQSAAPDGVRAFLNDRLPSGLRGKENHHFWGDTETLIGTNNADELEAAPKYSLVEGRGGDDILRGTKGGDTLKGGEGHDALSAGEGTNLLTGENGTDTLSGGKGSDVLLGGEGGDILRGGLGTDLLSGDNGDDSVMADGDNSTLIGGNGNDFIFAGRRYNKLYGDAGSDNLFSEGGYALCVGGSGADFFNTENGHLSDTIYAGNQAGPALPYEQDLCVVDRKPGTLTSLDKIFGAVKVIEKL